MNEVVPSTVGECGRTGSDWRFCFLDGILKEKKMFRGLKSVLKQEGAFCDEVCG